MSLTTDKRKINYFIACGYCLVILIILFNYLRTPRKTSFREGTRAAHSDNTSNEANKELENQLNEQKRMNKEMREMLLDIHNTQSTRNDKSFSSTKTEVSFSSTPSNKNIDNPPQSVKEINTKSYELPQLSSGISNKFINKGIYPFEVDKNPFAISEGSSARLFSSRKAKHMSAVQSGALSRIQYHAHAHRLRKVSSCSGFTSPKDLMTASTSPEYVCKRVVSRRNGT